MEPSPLLALSDIAGGEIHHQSLEFIRLAAEQQSNDQTEETQHTGEDLNDEDFDEHACICGIRKGGTAAVDPHADAADEIAHSDRQSRPEEGIAGIIVRTRVEGLFRHHGEFGGEDDGHDDTVDCDDLAENNRNQILGSYPRRFDATSEDGGSCDKDAPAVVLHISQIHVE